MCLPRHIYHAIMTAAQPPIQVFVQIIFTSEYGSRVPLNFTVIHAWLIFLGFFQFILNFFCTHISDQTSFSKVKGNHGTIPINENNSGQDLYWGLCCQLLYVA